RRSRIARVDILSPAVRCSKGAPALALPPRPSAGAVLPYICATPPRLIPPPGAWSARQIAAFRIREAAAPAHLDPPEPAQRSHGDEARYPDKRASFANTLPHNDAAEIDADAYATFVSVLSSGDPDKFETIPRDRRAETELNDPQATYSFDLAGVDSGA